MPAALHLGDADLPGTADLVVVGGGLAGLWTAFLAARASVGRVVLLERRGAVAHLTSAHSAEGFRLEWDSRENVDMVRRSVELFDAFPEVVGVPGWDLRLQKNGYLFLSGSEGARYRSASLRSRVERWHREGLADVEYLSGAEARDRFPFVGEAAEEAHFRAGDGFVDAGAIAGGLLRGGAFTTHLDTGVARIRTLGGRVAGVETAAGQTLAAPAVVVAAGPFSRVIAATAGPELPLESRRRHGLTVFLPEPVDQTWPMVVDADLGLYWRPRPEGIFVGWERALPWDERPAEGRDPVPADPRYLDQVRVHGARLTTFWRELRFDDVLWHTGQYVAARPYDGRPVIGQHPDVPGLYLHTAYEGRGIMASPAGAELLVRLLQGGEDGPGNPFRVSLGDRGHRPDGMVL